MSLTIPSQVRASDYSRVDDTLEPRPSVWRLYETGYKRIFENDQEQVVSDAPRNLNDGEVLSYNFTVMVQMDIQAGDVLGFSMREQNGRIQHLPLLFKSGPTRDSFTPIIIANFTATSYSSQPGTSDGEFKIFQSSKV